MDVVSQNEGNELLLKVVLVNTDTIPAGFVFKVEGCDDGPIFSPTSEMDLSIEPEIPVFKNFTIKAAVQDSSEKFKCNAVLYDSQYNKLD